MISYHRRCIFIHIPKTGGTSLENLIWAPHERHEGNLCQGFVSEFRNKYQTGGLQHLLACHVRAEVGHPMFESCFKFTVVRNPWDRSVSQYAYMARREDLRRFIGMRDGAGFKTYLALIRRRAHVQWTPQLNFLLDENGESMADYIGRYESFADAVAHVQRTLGLPLLPPPHVNRSEHRPYPDYYDDEAREMVAEMYARDIRAFGYRFDQSDAVAVSARRHVA